FVGARIGAGAAVVGRRAARAALVGHVPFAHAGVIRGVGGKTDGHGGSCVDPALCAARGLLCCTTLPRHGTRPHPHAATLREDRRMKIATFNVNGIKTRLRNLLAWLQREQPDVACLQELKALDDSFPKAELLEAGYHALWRG